MKLIIVNVFGIIIDKVEVDSREIVDVYPKVVDALGKTFKKIDVDKIPTGDFIIYASVSSEANSVVNKYFGLIVDG